MRESIHTCIHAYTNTRRGVDGANHGITRRERERERDEREGQRERERKRERERECVPSLGRKLIPGCLAPYL